jgi:hypothetical protein
MKRWQLFCAMMCLLGILSGLGWAQPCDDPPPRVSVILALFDAPSGQDFTSASPYGLGALVTDNSQLITGSQVYLEVWVTTPPPNAVGSAVMDISYNTAYFDSSTSQVSRSNTWNLLPFCNCVNDGAGLIDDLGGNTFDVQGIFPEWSRIATIELDVSTQPPAGETVSFVGMPAGGFPPRRFVLFIEGAVAEDEADYGQYTVGQGISDCNGNVLPDDIDIEMGSSPDCDADCLPDECENDVDGDQVIDDCDRCPNDPYKVDPGVCGCGVPDDDSDGDNTQDCVDACPNDAAKTDPGVCGCGVPDTDSDGDLTPDCNDLCPADPDKTDPGFCGCGVSDVDTDGDAVADCLDVCPGFDDNADADGDNAPDGCDGCPNEAALIEPSEPGTEVSCADGIDNDCDGTTDAFDGDCSSLCPTFCGDLDGSGLVDLDDFATFATCFALSFPTVDCNAAEFACSDLNVSGAVDLDDFATFAVVFATAPTSTVPGCLN